MGRSWVARRVGERMAASIATRGVAIILLVLATGLAVTACGTGSGGAETGSQPDGAVLAESGVSRTEASAPQSDVESVADSIEMFGADLYRALAEKAGDGNLVFSPSSIATALAMTYAGAAGTTAEEMAATLHFKLQDGALHHAFNSLDTVLESRNFQQENRDGLIEGVQLWTADSLWAGQGSNVEAGFLDALAANYDAGVRLVDFDPPADKARRTINEWVAEETNDIIPEFVPPGAFEGLDQIMLMLVNAVYLDANWADQFRPQETAEGEFVTLAGDTVTTPMMHKESHFFPYYAAGNGWQAVELPYVGRQLAMLLIIPGEGRLTDIESRLASGLIGDVCEQLSEGTEVRLTMPRFEFCWKAGLKDVLAALGMGSAFESDLADFSVMNSADRWYLADVVHEAYISVDEEGTVAAATTAATMVAAVSVEPPVELNIDRPFIFAVRDRETGAILFLGRVTDPTA